MAYTAVGPQDLERACLIWTKFQVPKDLEIEWDGLFLPLIRAPGHLGSGWARLRDSDIILLVTGNSWISARKTKLIVFKNGTEP
jgi:hypothetical protein